MPFSRLGFPSPFEGSAFELISVYREPHHIGRGVPLGCLDLDWFPWILERAVPLVSPNTKKSTLNSQSRSFENRISPPRLVSFWFPLKHPRGLRNHLCLWVFLFGWRNWFPCGFSLKPKNGNNSKTNKPCVGQEKIVGVCSFLGHPPPLNCGSPFSVSPLAQAKTNPTEPQKYKEVPALGAKRFGSVGPGWCGPPRCRSGRSGSWSRPPVPASLSPRFLVSPPPPPRPGPGCHGMRSVYGRKTVRATLKPRSKPGFVVK